MLIKSILNVKITLNVDWYINKTKENTLLNISHTLNVLSENGLCLPEWGYFLKSKNNVNFTKMCLLEKL